MVSQKNITQNEYVEQIMVGTGDNMWVETENMRTRAFDESFLKTNGLKTGIVCQNKYVFLIII